MRFVKHHWLTLIGILSNLPSVWRGLVWLFDWEVRVETVLQKLGAFGGARGVIQFLINPPPWLALVTLPIGFALIWWDLKRRPVEAAPISQAHLGVRTPQALLQRAKIVFGTRHPFETVDRVGQSMNRTVRVKIKNGSDVEITNGMLQLEGLDPPNKDHIDFLLRNQIRIGALGQEYIDIASYSEGASSAKPAPWINLIVPAVAGSFFGPPPNLIPVGSYTFHLKFSSLESGELARAYCRLAVENNILRLHDWGDSANLPSIPEAQEISLMEAVTRAYEGIKDKPISIVIEGLANSPDDILTWLCNALTRYQDGNEPLVKLRGNKPPSRVKEEIYMAPFSGYDFVVEGRTIVFQERHGQMRYEGLSVSTSELEPAIQKLASREV